MLLTRDSLWGRSAAGGRPGGVCLGGGGGLLPGFPRASSQEGSWSLRGSWVLGRPLLGGIGRWRGTRLPGQGVVGRSQMDSLVEGQETDQLPPRAHVTIQLLRPKRMGLQPCGRPVGRWLDWGLWAGQSGLQTPVPGGAAWSPRRSPGQARSAGALGEAGSSPSAGQGHTGARLCLLARAVHHRGSSRGA